MHGRPLLPANTQACMSLLVTVCCMLCLHPGDEPHDQAFWFCKEPVVLTRPASGARACARAAGAQRRTAVPAAAPGCAPTLPAPWLHTRPARSWAPTLPSSAEKHFVGRRCLDFSTFPSELAARRTMAFAPWPHTCPARSWKPTLPNSNLMRGQLTHGKRRHINYLNRGACDFKTRRGPYFVETMLKQETRFAACENCQERR